MANENITKILLSLNNDRSDIGKSKDNVWSSKNEKYTDFIEKLTDIVTNEKIRGSVLIASDTEIIWASGTRSKDINGETVSPLTTYEIGSITKTFTASCIFRLIEENKLALSDKVTAFFPEYTKAGDMTVYDLLHMRSGIPDFADEFEYFFDLKNNDEGFEQSFWKGEVNDEVFLEALYKLDLKFTPASQTSYSNTNYVLLAMIIERTAGKSYKEYVEDMIFNPLGMTASSSESTGDVTSCPEEKDGYHLAQHSARGAGDIHSNVLDMLKFDRAFFTGKIVSTESLKTMLKFDDGYGCGWTTDGFCWWHEEGTPFDTDLVFHSGETLSYVCDNIVFNASGNRLYLIMMCPCFTDTTKKIVELCKAHLPQIIK